MARVIRIRNGEGNRGVPSPRDAPTSVDYRPRRRLTIARIQRRVRRTDSTSGLGGTFRPQSIRDLFVHQNQTATRNHAGSHAFTSGKPGSAPRRRDLGRGGDRRRSHRAGHGRRRRDARLPNARPRIPRLRHGTSSRSTKLVHGGVRYLAQGNLHLVREAAARTRAARAQRPAPGPYPRVHGSGLSLLAAAVLRDRPLALRPTRRAIGAGPLAMGFAGDRHRPGPDDPPRPPPRRDSLLRRPVRRRPTGDHAGLDRRRPGCAPR